MESGYFKGDGPTLMSREQERKVTKYQYTRYRTWCGTIWNDQDEEYLKTLDYKYLLIGHLEQTKRKQPHKHVLIRFKSQRVMPKTQNAHWEKCDKVLNFRAYALKKGEASFESGELDINVANENEWEEFIEACKQMDPKQLIESRFSRIYARYRNFAGEIHNIFREIPIIDGELENEWWWGPAGTGKSMKAFTEYPDAYIKSLNKWWDGYHDQEVVIIDDWGPNQSVLVDHLKHWADRYPFPAEVKGSSMRIRPKKIIVTSNYAISDCFERIEDQEAIRRRFKVTRFHKGLGE